MIVDSPAVADLLVIDNALAGPGPDFVGIDDRAAAETAVAPPARPRPSPHRHGRASASPPACMPGPADTARQAHGDRQRAKARLEGSARAVTAAGLDWPSVPVEQVPITSVEVVSPAPARCSTGHPASRRCSHSATRSRSLRDGGRERGLLGRP